MGQGYTAGTASTDSECNDCTGNTYSDGGTGSCTQCAAGSGVNNQNSECTPCAAGSFSSNGESCQSCPGTAQSSTAGSPVCNTCIAEYGSNSTDVNGHIVCELCNDNDQNTNMYNAYNDASPCGNHDTCVAGEGYS